MLIVVVFVCIMPVGSDLCYLKNLLTLSHRDFEPPQVSSLNGVCLSTSSKTSLAKCSLLVHIIKFPVFMALS